MRHFGLGVGTPPWQPREMLPLGSGSPIEATTGLILEGVTGSGKSTLLRALQRRILDRYPNRTKLVFSEHYTERMLEHHKEEGALTEAMVLEHLGTMLEPVEKLAAMKARSKFAARGGNSNVLAIYERFLLGHVANMRMRDERSWVLLGEATGTLLCRVERLGFQIVVLHVPEQDLGKRVLSTRAWRNQAWKDHLAQIGDDAAVVDYYCAWQRHLQSAASTLLGRSPLTVDASMLATLADYDELATKLLSVLAW